MLLRQPIYLYGTVKLYVLIGTVDVFGYTATTGELLEIFSAKGCNMIKVQNMYSEESLEYDEVFIRESVEKVKSDFTSIDLRNIRRQFVSKTDAIIVLQRNNERRKLVNNFKLFMVENVFPNIKSFEAKPPFGGTEHLLKCKILTKSEQELKIPFNWNTFTLAPKARLIVAGGKGVGKSTFVRFLINKYIGLYKKIVLIDLDIGQPEIFVPQTISYTVIRTPLLGPGFFMNKQPHKAYVIGHTNVIMCTSVYRLAVRDLITECQTTSYLKEYPWIVNTMGYNKGFGVELMAMIAEKVQPTDIIQINCNKDINNYEVDLNHANLVAAPSRFIDETVPNEKRQIPEFQFHKFETAFSKDSHHQKEWAMSAKDLRYANIIARLSDCLYGEAQMLTDCKPFWIPLQAIQLFNAVSPSQQNKGELLRAAEGNLVYLCGFVAGFKSIECFGIGVVRAVDYVAERIYLVPAMPTENMKYVNYLVMGEMALPSSIYLNQGYAVNESIPFVFETDDANASKAIKQIFYRPSEYFMGTRNPES